jgi:hypothetical protein
VRTGLSKAKRALLGRHAPLPPLGT